MNVKAISSQKEHRYPHVPSLWTAVLGFALCTGSIDLFHVYLSYRLDIERMNWSRTAAVFIVWWLTYAVVLVAALFLARRYPLVPRFRVPTFALHFFAAAVLSYIHTACNALAYPPPLYSDASTLHVWVYLARMNFPIDFISYWAVVGVVYAFHFYSSVQEKKVAEAELTAKAQQLQARLVEARLNALRSQLNPHFLFNTLNALSTLVLKGDTGLANCVISRLAGLLRVCLNDKRPQLIPLASELEFLNNYIEIQHLLLGDRLTVERNIEQDTLHVCVPCMLLQPIIENALVHGVANQDGPGTIVIHAARVGECLQITVTDNGPGLCNNLENRAGVGLTNTKARLQHLYGGAHDLSFGQTAKGGALICLRIPVHTPDPASSQAPVPMGAPVA